MANAGFEIKIMVKSGTIEIVFNSYFLGGRLLSTS